MAAAALRVFLRRRARAPAPASPSLALLQPLFSGVPYYEQTRYPLHAAAGLPDSRCAQLDPAAVPSMFRRYSGKGYEPTPPWKPTNPPAMWGLKQVATAAANLPDKHRVQLSPPPMLSLVHHYSSKGDGMQWSQQPIDRQVTQNLKQDEEDCYTFAYNKIDIVEWFLNGLEKDCKECIETMIEALDTYGKGFQLLEEGLDSQAFAMFEKGLDDTLKDMLELNQKFYKEMEEFHKFSRRSHERLSSSVKTLKTLKNRTDLLTAVSAGLGACLLLLLMFIFGILA